MKHDTPNKTLNRTTAGNWSVFTAEEILSMMRVAYESGFNDAKQALIADLDKLRDPVKLHPSHQWLRNHFETLVTTAQPRKEPYAKQV